MNDDNQHAAQIANGVLLQVLLEVGGVDRHQLRLCVELKNALIEDLDHEPDEKWIDGLHRELTAMAGTVDQALRDAERDDAQDAFRRVQGVGRRPWRKRQPAAAWTPYAT